MNTTFQCVLLATTSMLLSSTAAQAAQGPASFDGNQIPLEVVDVISVAGPDYDRLRTEDLTKDNEIGPRRFAVAREVSVTPSNHGTWEHTTNGRMLWRLSVDARGSKHVNLGFGDWNLPASGEAWISSADGDWVLNPITSADNITEQELWTALVPSDQVLIEVSMDAAERDVFMANTTLTHINVGYRGFGSDDGTRGTSESCNVDVICSLGDDWRDEIPSVGLMIIGGSGACTGVMINNTFEDETPYFLTADHCGVSASNDQTIVVYWNFENSYCRTPGSNDSGGNGNGNLNQVTTGGSTLLANGSGSDYCLIRLNNSPNPNYEVTFSGWNRSSSTPSDGAGIHHPNSAEKRISSVDNVFSQGSFWIVNWGEGRTYFGSSGSPLYDANYRIVGQLYGGSSFCTNDSDDVYGKLSSSWSGLRDYLDPSGSNASTLNTLNPYDGSGNGGVCCVGSTCFVVPIENCGCSTCTWYPDMLCNEVDCSVVIVKGACCLDTGECLSSQTPEQCATAGGDYQGDDSSCASANCPQPEPTGACCVNGNCISGLTAGECVAGSGEYQGNDTSCDFVNCDVVSDYVEFKHVIVGENLVPGIGPNFTVDIMAAVLPGNRIDAVAGNSSQSKVLSSTNGFYQNSSGGPLSTDINPNFYTFVPELEWDSRVTIGALDQTGAPFGSNALGSVGINWTQFENGGTLSVSNGTWYVLPDDEQGNAEQFTANDCSNREGVRIARLTVNGLDSTVSIEALLQGRDGLGNTWQDGASYSFDYEAIVDCNGNSVSDTCDIANGDSQDSDGNGIPDECDNSDCFGDINGDGGITVDDLLFLLGEFGQDCSGGCDSDINDDDAVDVNDLLELLGVFGNDC